MDITTRTYQSEAEISSLFEQFCSKTLEKEKWTHAAHLTTGLCFLKQYDLHEATCRMKSGIISYNLSVGGENTGTGGYHETLTIFWMEILHFYHTGFPEIALPELCHGFLQSPLADKKLPFYFYNQETLMSSLYRARYRAPDKQEMTPEVLKEILTNGANLLK
ncbi:MAG: hypothetical protein HUU01_23035 [Saprospiraceae bacterium]|nr:hypothetical protein [Saprospiraceae bacterium]